MSFLSTLRERQPDDEHGLQLCYVFTIDRLSGTLNLQLCLANKRERCRGLAARAYRLQRGHLTRPPAFIAPADQAVLRALSDADPQWFGCAQAAIPASIPWSWMQQMLATGRCYLTLPAGDWRHVNAAGSRPIEPFWSIDGAGEQALGWRLAQDASPYPLIFLNQQALYCRPVGAELHMGLGVALPQFEGAPTTARLAPPQLGAFFERQAPDWRRRNLPLPQPLPTTAPRVQLKPLLCCTPARRGEEIHLQFSLCDARFCSLPAIEIRQITYWDGHHLQMLYADAREMQRLREAVRERLQNFKRDGDDVDIWRPQGEREWQRLFTRLRGPLAALGAEFAFAPGFRHHFVLAERWQVQLGEGHGGGLNVSVRLQTQGGDIDLEDLLTQLRAFNLRTQDHDLSLRLADGRLLLLPAREAVCLLEELEDLPVTGEGFYLADSQRHRLAALRALLPADSHWCGCTQPLDDAIRLHQSPVVLDSKLTCVDASLRPYQWLGVCWIQHLKQHRCHGLLADDMGLGKTLQALTHLAFEKQRGHLGRPALILVPLSLVHNWVGEIERFAPQLRHNVVHGVRRHDNWPDLGDYDVLITTYHLAAIDLDEWRAQEISWLILDEAQNIKNPATRFSQAVRDIPCAHKLCLSGTPVENHLGELWAIMDFLMPGALGGRQQFKQHFQKPIEQQADAGRMRQLLKRVAPFMLRRTKDQIARDLPPKTEIARLISLSAPQREFYQQLKRDTWEDLQAKLADADHGGQRHMLALTALLKLRQACCDPGLVADVDLPSAKREYCLHMIEELVAEQRAVLVFSQFTAMLEILARSLAERNVASLMLSGKSRQRQATVEAFQRGEAPVFLISLKAGGTGLNLTRADTVIHYDPWWNSAAERQASDRAHRIGQDKPVFVYKLIAENTVEEKIARLQAHKAELGAHIDNQAQLNAEAFALKFEELLTIWQEEKPLYEDKPL